MLSWAPIGWALICKRMPAPFFLASRVMGVSATHLLLGVERPLNFTSLPPRPNDIRSLAKSQVIGPSVLNHWAPRTASQPSNDKRKKSVVMGTPCNTIQTPLQRPELSSLSPEATITCNCPSVVAWRPALLAILVLMKLCVLPESNRMVS